MMTFRFFSALFISMPSCLFPPIVPFSLLSPPLDPNGINPGRHFAFQFYKLLHIMDNDPDSIGYTPPYNLVCYNFMCPLWQHISIIMISPSHALSNLREGSEWRDAGIYYCKLLICPSQYVFHLEEKTDAFICNFDSKRRKTQQKVERD